MPLTTYRLQLHKAFTLGDAGDLVEYLALLGVTDLYLSPISTARPGSTHGYDVCNHNEINPELGGEAGFAALAGAVRAAGMGLVLDFVPNHMSNDPHTNEWWRDVLENGPSSPFAHFFDVDWEPVKPELKERLLLPILTEQYGEALEGGLLRLHCSGGVLTLEYRGQRIPINPRRIPVVLGEGVDALEAALGPDDPDLVEFLSVLTSLRNLPPYTERDKDKINERRREKEVARARLERLVSTSAPIREHIERVVQDINGTPGVPSSFDRLHELLEMQAYRLASWRNASDEINYRRFFDINELAGLRVEDPVVFEELHRLLLRLIGTGVVVGVRLDHIDGLFDPRGYLMRLQQAAQEVLPSPVDQPRGRFFLAVEKILSVGETLPGSWPVAGTTGYNFLNEVGGLFVDPRAAANMRRLYTRFTDRYDPFDDVAYESKRLIVSTAMSSEFQVLAQAVNRLSEHDRRTRDFTFGSIRRALREMVACFPVYRTYVTASSVSDRDAQAVDVAIDDARRRNPAMEDSIFDFLRRILLPAPDVAPDQDPLSTLTPQLHEIATRFQQYTAPVHAKGVEDTAFYRFNVLTSLNEVGGDPRHFGRSVDEFHNANLARLSSWPGEMLTTTTHDTKRAEDVRSRLHVLSERPDDWRRALMKWSRLNRAGRSSVDGHPAPDGNDEYLFYQALLGVWPAGPADERPPRVAPDDLVDRMAAYMAKAIREAKTYTSWISPNEDYEAAVATFVEHALRGERAARFLKTFVPFARDVARVGAVNSLAQLVLKIASPGVPDFYQGSEFWDLSLVDPDNRRPVDYGLRRQCVEAEGPWIERALAGQDDEDPDLSSHVGELLDTWFDGRIKMFVTACGLRFRRAHGPLFREGQYRPLSADGAHGEHVVAFAREREGAALVAVVPRLSSGLARGRAQFPVGDVWGDTRLVLPAGWAQRTFRDVLTGRRVPPDLAADAPPGLLLSSVFGACPVALLWSTARG